MVTKRIGKGRKRRTVRVFTKTKPGGFFRKRYR